MQSKQTAIRLNYRDNSNIETIKATRSYLNTTTSVIRFALEEVATNGVTCPTCQRAMFEMISKVGGEIKHLGLWSCNICGKGSGEIIINK